jgi:hypothetical protein
MNPSYRRFWLGFFTVIAAAVWAAVDGESFIRRRLYPPDRAPESERRSDQFIALAFPKLSLQRDRYVMAQDEFEDILRGLKGLGYRSIGLDDVRDFLAKKRKLPPRAVLLALDRDDPDSVRLADESLRRLRMRGVLFLSERIGGGDTISRHAVSPHALRTLIRGGGWDVGLGAPDAVRRLRPEFCFSLDGAIPASWEKCANRFVTAKTGWNGAPMDPRLLRILSVRWDRPSSEVVRFIHDSWGATRVFVDHFDESDLKLDWIPDWGYVGLSRRRLALIPRPRQTGAAVWLHGTDQWRDVELELILEKYNRSFWAYARAADSSRYLRVGASSGWWKLQQQTGPGSAPVTLARAPVDPQAFPARLFLVVKGERALAYVNGRLLFGRGVPLDQSISRGRIQLAIYDRQPRTALALVSYFRARPLPQRWLSFLDDDPVLDPRALDEIRSRAAESHALSPRWMRVNADGTPSLNAPHAEFIRSLAGYYNCGLVPMIELSPAALNALERPGVSRELASYFASASRGFRAKGLNLRLPVSGEASRPQLEFARILREQLRASGQDLWITVDGGRPGPGISQGAIDVLRAGPSLGAGVQALVPADVGGGS